MWWAARWGAPLWGMVAVVAGGCDAEDGPEWLGGSVTSGGDAAVPVVVADAAAGNDGGGGLIGGAPLGGPTAGVGPDPN